MRNFALHRHSRRRKVLARLVAEVDRIRAGIATREELEKAHVQGITFDEALERFQIKMRASGGTERHIQTTLRHVLQILGGNEMNSITKICREAVERWIADEMQSKTRSPRTINSYLGSIKSFTQYLTDIEVLPTNPLKSIRNLNEAIDQRKKRRTMTANEVQRLLSVADSRRRLIYRLSLGTGLRSTELSLLTPNQINVERCRLTIEAAKTKNKKADVLPMKAELVQAVKEWIEENGIQPHEHPSSFSET
jgi:integrase